MYSNGNKVCLSFNTLKAHCLFTAKLKQDSKEFACNRGCSLSSLWISSLNPLDLESHKGMKRGKGKCDRAKQCELHNSSIVKFMMQLFYCLHLFLCVCPRPKYIPGFIPNHQLVNEAKGFIHIIHDLKVSIKEFCTCMYTRSLKQQDLCLPRSLMG